jgi:hypothetical protein
MKDFNVYLLRDSVASRSLVEHFQSLSLSVVNREPSHFQSVGDPFTLIDFFVTNSSEDVDVDVPRPIQDVDEFDWTTIYTTPSVEQVDFFNGAVCGFFNAHVPLKRGRRRPLVNLWYNAFVGKANVDRDMAFRFWRSSRTLELQEIYKPGF